MPTHNNFLEVFEHLKSLLTPFAPHLKVTTDSPGNYYLDAGYAAQFKKELFFGAVQIKKNYVSFHLMGLYAHPELQTGLSPELLKHKQGKACFNFKKVEPALFAELAGLVERCYRFYEQAGWLSR